MMQTLWLAHLQTAWQAVRAARLRALLSVLGVTIGVASTVLVAATGNAAQQMVRRTLESMGTQKVMVFAAPDAQQRLGPAPRHSRLAEADARLLVQAPGALDAAPQLRGTARLQTASKAADTQLIGVDPGYFRITPIRLLEGRALAPEDLQRRVLMLGQQTARKLFENVSPIGQRVRVQRSEFEVVGVFGGGQSGAGGDEAVALLPLQAMRARVQRAHSGTPEGVDLIEVQFAEDQPLDLARDSVLDLLRTRHQVRPGDGDPFTVETTEEFARHSESVLGALRAGLTAIAAISLLVGGIGIANIMLVAVSERAREIGIRMAVGARPRDIRQQFLVEAALVCALGGAIGIGLAWLLASGAAALTSWPLSISPGLALAALALAASVGLVAGAVPAARAAALEPSEALRRD